MSTWYFPSWNGDVRIAVDPSNNNRTIVTIIEPTSDELRVLKSCAAMFGSKGWMGKRKTLWNPRGDRDRQETVVHAPLADIGLLMISQLKPGIATLTAVKLEGGEVRAKGSKEKGFFAWVKGIFDNGAELGSVGELADRLGQKTETPKGELQTSPHRTEAKLPPGTELSKVEKVASVKRPTPCCPQCLPGAIEPANEVLQSFLTPEQHELWAKDRAIVVHGGLTGHRYLVSHRNGRHAVKAGKICFDLDDADVMHFHDNTVPPEEEVLAAKLILEHRENWLRHEACCLGTNFDFVFKNPFGDMNDGVPDSQFTAEIGSFFRGFGMGFGGGLAHKEDEQYTEGINYLLDSVLK